MCRSAMGIAIALKPKRDRRGDVAWRVLDMRLPGDRGGQDQRMQRQHVDERVEPVLVQHGETDQHQPAGQHMGNVEIEAVRHMPPDTNSSSTPSRLSISAAPRKFGHPEHAHLGDRHLEHAEQRAGHRQLDQPRRTRPNA